MLLLIFFFFISLTKGNVEFYQYQWNFISTSFRTLNSISVLAREFVSELKELT